MGLLRRLVGGGNARPATVVRAIWRDTVLAESATTVSVDERHYFPPGDVRWEFLRPIDKETVCLWKGRAGYYDVEVDGHRMKAAAWVYPHPQPSAAELKEHVAFAKGVKVRAIRDASSRRDTGRGVIGDASA